MFYIQFCQYAIDLVFLDFINSELDKEKKLSKIRFWIDPKPIQNDEHGFKNRQ